jgi:isopenicillin N synthase-like dioxygenase
MATLTTPAGASGLEETMPPNFVARVGNLQTFKLPDQVTGGPDDIALGKALIDCWRSDGILQIAMNGKQGKLLQDAFTASKQFFRKPHVEKAACVDSQSYSGYIASGEEVTNGVADYSEIFTVTKDLDLSVPEVKEHWPCHGPCPWPDAEMKSPMQLYITYLGETGEKLLQLIEYGLGLEPSSLTKYTKHGWHHMRILRLVLPC